MSENRIIGTENNDILSGTVLDDDIFALDGDDEITVTWGNNFVDGGDGDDKLIIDYSTSESEISFSIYHYFNGYSYSSWLDIYFPSIGSGNYVDFNNIENLVINSGSGHDFIDLGYDNSCDYEINTGAGDDFVYASLSNGIIDGGAGFDMLFLDFEQSQTGITSVLTDSHNGQYSNGEDTISFRNVEIIDVFGSNYDDVFMAVTGSSENKSMVNPIDSWIDGLDGQDLIVADYSLRTEDLKFSFNNRGSRDSIDVNSDLTQYSSSISFTGIESFTINSGSGDDEINLAYDNYADNEVNAGAGDDLIITGWGNDTMVGGSGNDTYFYDLKSGKDVILDSDGDKDLIIFGDAINFDNLSLDINNNDLIVSFDNFPREQLIINNYGNSFDSIENIQVAGEVYSLQEIIDQQSEIS